MKFTTSLPPYAVPRNSVGRVMRLVLVALVPAAAAHVYFFGWGLLVNIGLAGLAAVVTEWIALRLRGVPPAQFLSDGSALVTAVLLAFALPPLLPWWLTVSGAAFAIVFAKHLYGGLGYNPFNPAMVGYVVLLVSFPVEMTSWPAPAGFGDAPSLSFGQTVSTILMGSPPAPLEWDGLTRATALDAVRTGLTLGATMQEVTAGPAFGAFGARGSEWVAAASLLGGVALLALGIIRWHIPVAMLLTIVVLATVAHGIDPGTYPGPLFHLFSGATMLGAFFIATDPVSAST
ncbi:MAG TPA: RnfABCDGE type electron transport complex subunit D, partial [Steroidobacteraceae bacterium]|nr:RnfABCDGE type electron transport complex subunit D [Steroidobacteraceae bacterium]